VEKPGSTSGPSHGRKGDDYHDGRHLASVLLFAGERIEVGLKRGKFDYVSSTSTNARRIGATGAKRKEGDTHAVTSALAWVKPP